MSSEPSLSPQYLQVVLENVLDLYCFLFQMPNIKLESSDGEIFEVDVEIVQQSVLLNPMLEGEFSFNSFQLI